MLDHIESNHLFYGLLGVNWFIFLWDLYLDYRQYCVHKNAVTRPEKVKDIITEEEFKKARDYKLDKHRWGFVSDIFEQIVTTAVLCLYLMPMLWDLCAAVPLQGAAFVVANTVIHSIVEMPFDMIDTFWVEQKHGFNKQTLGFYLKDTLKKQVVSAVITVPVVVIVEWIVANGGEYFFFYIWAFVSCVIFLMLTVYPVWIAPLFDTYIPLPDGDLKEKIEALAKSVAYPLTKLFVVHGSARSAHSNAYMYGFWKNKRIVLYDTLLSGEEKEKVEKEVAAQGLKDEEEEKKEGEEKEKKRGMTNDEVVAVLGHELGHWALSHTVMNIFIAEANLFFMFLVFSQCYKWKALYEAFGFSSTPTIIGLLLVFQYVMAIYSHLFGILMSVHSRRCEFQADAYAAELNYADLLKSALTKLSTDNLSMPIDDYWYSLFNHSHPPVVERIAALNELEKKNKKRE